MASLQLSVKNNSQWAAANPYKFLTILLLSLVVEKGKMLRNLVVVEKGDPRQEKTND